VRDSGIRYCTVCNYDFVLATRTALPPAATPPAAPPQAGQPRPGVTGSTGGPGRRYLGSVGGLSRRVLAIGLVIDVLIVLAVILLLGHRV
jgi:hypothetical protein